MWACAPKPEPGDKYGFTHFARTLCDGTGVDPLPSDSRRRPDRAALEAGDQRSAGAHKHALEEAQRAERRAREEEARKGGSGGAAAASAAPASSPRHGDVAAGWTPRWFKPVDPVVAKAAGDLHANDADPADCPLFEWAGGDLGAALGRGGAGEPGAPSCSGRGFNPWQFPDLHTSLTDYEAPPLPPAAE